MKSSYQVTLPFECEAADRAEGMCLHDGPYHVCAELRLLRDLARELEPNSDRLLHMAIVVLASMFYFDPSRDDLAYAVAAFTGYPYDLVRHWVDFAQRVLFDEGKMPPEWVGEHGPAALLMDALVVLRVLDRQKDGTEVLYRRASISVEEAGWRLRRWDRSPLRCQDARSSGRQCTWRVRSDADISKASSRFCSQHGKTVVVFEANSDAGSRTETKAGAEGVER